MNDPLGTYLHDHLAGARFGLELLEALCAEDNPPGVVHLAEKLRLEIEADRETLESIAKAIELDASRVKDAVGWLAEKASRLKLRRHSSTSLGLFESLEALSLGILGKKALWDALSVVALSDPRLAGPDYGTLSVRAWQQHVRVEEKRLEVARELFAAVPVAQ